jgi:hypothetical protein
MSVTAQDCVSPSIGPSRKTLAAFQERLSEFSKQAVPWNGVKVDKDLKFSSQALHHFLEPSHRELKLKTLHLL